MNEWLTYGFLAVILSPYLFIIVGATRDTWATSHWLTVRNWMIALVGVGGGLWLVEYMTADAFLGLLFTGGVLTLLFAANTLSPNAVK